MKLYSKALTVLALTALAVAGCGEDSGSDGTSCTVADNGDGSATISCEDGTAVTLSDGSDGTACAVADNGDGTTTINCDDGTTATVTNGADGARGPEGAAGAEGTQGAPGEACTIAQNGDGTSTITCGDVEVVVSDGEDGEDGEDGVNWEGYVPLEELGVVGVVTDRTGTPVRSGTVYFVPAASVAELPATTTAVGSSNDEPLEDLIAASGDAYPQAEIDALGRFVVPTLEDGRWFITFVPADDDPGHYPGGSLCRTARETSEIVGTRVDIAVSSATPHDAEYVGSGACVRCHGLTHVADTMHRNGIWSPYDVGPLQNLPDELWWSFEDKFDAETTVWFYGYDSTRGFDKYLTSESDPGTGNVSFTVTVREREGSYEMLLENVANPADPDWIIRVDAVYGGGIWKQRYLTRVTTSFGTFWTLMPLQYNYAGADDPTYPRTSRQWRDYHGDWWYNESTRTFRNPNAGQSFERNCASCHAVGAQITGSSDTIWEANVISDRIWGDFDFTGDGIADEMNVGCESCHGPGSAHWAQAGLGRDIVSPSLLTPEREAMICGQCHSRPKGSLGTDSPVDAEGWMMVAGTSRNDFLTFHATTQLDGGANDFHADAARHSRSHHQQYSDFIRSQMYKNDTELMTCSSCHDPHSRENPRQLRADPSDNSALCGGACHSAQADDLRGHINTQLGAGMGSLMDFASCSDCHMPRTATTGAGEPGVTIGGVLYWQGDISSHMFDVPPGTVSRDTRMATPFTNSCASSCHTAF